MKRKNKRGIRISAYDRGVGKKKRRKTERKKLFEGKEGTGKKGKKRKSQLFVEWK